jgi:hypothetical protein
MFAIGLRNDHPGSNTLKERSRIARNWNDFLRVQALLNFVLSVLPVLTNNTFLYALLTASNIFRLLV